MRKDYKTIKEVVGPLMLVDCVENVKYDELVEIHEKDGSVRLGKVWSFPFPPKSSGVYLTVSVAPSTAVHRLFQTPA